jgi:hypothetical protein
VFLTVAFGVPGRPDQEILSPTKSGNHFGNGLLGSHARFSATLAQIRNSHRAH